MIILVGVTISFVANGGLLDRAKQASTQYQIEADREMLLADVVASLDIDGKVDKRMLNTLATADGFNISGEEFPISATSKSGNEFSISENGEITYTGEGEYVRPETQDSDLAYLRTLIGTNIMDLVEDQSGLIFKDKNMEIDTSAMESFDSEDITMNSDGSFTEAIPIFYKNKPYTLFIKFKEGEENFPIVDVTTRTVNSSGSGSTSGSESYYSSDSGSESTQYNVYLNYENGVSPNSYESFVTEGETYTATFTASQDYRLPSSIIVSMSGIALTSSDYTWNSQTGVLTVPNVTGDLTIAVSGESLTRNVTFNLTNVTTNGTNTATEGNSYSCTFTANSDYKLPSTIEVTMGGTTLDIGQNQYTYNSQTGAFSIANVTGDISITITGEYLIKNVTFNLTHVTTNGTNTVTEGNSYQCTFTATAGNTLPANITVTMGGTTLDEGLNQYSWNNTTGAFSISKVTEDITITVAGNPKTAPASYSNAQSLSLGTGVSLIPYNEIGDLDDSSSSNTYLQNLGTNLINAIDSGKISAVLTEEINGVDTIAVIPAGFTVSSTTGENTISEGLVLRNGQNEFVWMPYTDSTVYVEDSFGPLTGTHTVSGTTYTYDTQEELTNCYGYTDANNTTPFFNISDFTYAQDITNIEESINKYRGFIVGRYETTITSAGVIGSMPNEDVLQSSRSIAQTNNQIVRWYGLYKVQKDLYVQNTSVFSSMITSKEWDKIMAFTGYGKTKRATDTYTTEPDKSGSGYKDSNPAEYDETHNIYDLAGNLHEWTLTAYTDDSRTVRGGDFRLQFFGEDGCSGQILPLGSRSRGSRFTLYIR